MLSEEVWAHSCGSSRGVSLRSRLRERGEGARAQSTLECGMCVEVRVPEDASCFVI